MATLLAGAKVPTSTEINILADHYEVPPAAFDLRWCRHRFEPGTLEAILGGMPKQQGLLPWHMRLRAGAVALMAATESGLDEVAKAIDIPRRSLALALSGRLALSDPAIATLAGLAGIPVAVLRGEGPPKRRELVAAAKRNLFQALKSFYPEASAVLALARAAAIIRGGLTTTFVMKEATLSLHQTEDPAHAAAMVAELVTQDDPRAIAAVKALAQWIDLDFDLAMDAVLLDAGVTGVARPGSSELPEGDFTFGETWQSLSDGILEDDPSMAEQDPEILSEVAPPVPEPVPQEPVAAILDAIPAPVSVAEIPAGPFARILATPPDWTKAWPLGGRFQALADALEASGIQESRRLAASGFASAEAMREAGLGERVPPWGAVEAMVGLFGYATAAAVGLEAWTCLGGLEEITAIPLDEGKRWPPCARLRTLIAPLLAESPDGFKGVAAQFSLGAQKPFTGSALESWIRGRYTPSDGAIEAMGAFLLVPAYVLTA
jgi:hypothetical protein